MFNGNMSRPCRLNTSQLCVLVGLECSSWIYVNCLISQFVAELRKLSEFCEFGDTLDVMLRDRLVCDLRNQKLQQRLLAESNLTFTKAFEIAQTAELSKQNAKDLQRPETMEVHVMNKKGQERTMATSNCFRCHGNHLASECRFRSVDCNNCGKRGHIAGACRQIREDRYPASAASSTRRVPRSRERKQDSPELLQTDTLYTFRSPDPLRAPVKINNVTIEMEIDTGAAQGRTQGGGVRGVRTPPPPPPPPPIPRDVYS